MLILILLFTAYFSLFTVSANADVPVNISADHLEYISETNTYVARGSVKIIYEGATLSADEIHLNSVTQDADAFGHVLYEDADAIIVADKVELNLGTKLGTLYNGRIFYKSRNYHIHGEEVKRTGEETYTLSKATATTCDAKPPEWYFKGNDVKITLHENVTAKNATFYLKGVPVLYAPYFWAPLLEERQTGLLMPNIGYNNSRGFTFKQGFFWAIEKNRDATLYLDYYSKKGLGKGIDYRYIKTQETNGEIWIYHLRDNDLTRDFLELKSYHNQKLPNDISGYLKLHLVNGFDYYRVLDSTSADRIGLLAWESDVFGFGTEERLQKNLESNLHVYKPFSFGRTYLLGQYRQSLEGSSGTIPQRLPQAGFIINTASSGNFSFNMAFTADNFWSKEDRQGQRVDFYPNFYFSTGRTVNFTQKAGLRETAYFLNDPAKNENRELYDLTSSVTTRFFKRYPSLLHSIEPLLEYTNIPAVDHDDIPVFDSADSIPHTSDITYALTNRFSGSILGSSEAKFRLSQSYSLLNVEKQFMPVVAEGSLSGRHLDLGINASYDVHDKTVEETIASVTVKGERGSLGVGKNFRHSTHLDQYTIEAGINRPLKSLPLDLYGKLLYDVNGGGSQELKFKTTYKSQCWGITIAYTKRPSEYQITVGIEFRGFGSIKLG
ncbi:MAG: LPS-assembly protein LptD [Nitrospirae bacterium]|nr:LPS-assembly protein LptD [Nitrospirota bacterium]